MLLITVFVVVVASKNHVFGGEVKNTTEQNTNNIAEKLEGEKEGDNKTNEETSKKKEILQYDGNNPNTTEKLSGVISYTGVTGGSLVIRVNIDQYLTSGNCTLNLIKNGTIIYSTDVRIETSVTTSTCSGFDIQISEFGSGKIEIEVILESDGKRGIITGEAEI